VAALAKNWQSTERSLITVAQAVDALDRAVTPMIPVPRRLELLESTFASLAQRGDLSPTDDLADRAAVFRSASPQSPKHGADSGDLAHSVEEKLAAKVAEEVRAVYVSVSQTQDRLRSVETAVHTLQNSDGVHEKLKVMEQSIASLAQTDDADWLDSVLERFQSVESSIAVLALSFHEHKVKNLAEAHPGSAIAEEAPSADGEARPRAGGSDTEYDRTEPLQGVVHLVSEVAESVASVRERLDALESSIAGGLDLNRHDADDNRLNGVEERLGAMDASVSAMVQSVEVQIADLTSNVESHNVDERLQEMNHSISALSLSVDQRMSDLAAKVEESVWGSSVMEPQQPSETSTVLVDDDVKIEDSKETSSGNESPSHDWLLSQSDFFLNPKDMITEINDRFASLMTDAVSKIEQNSEDLARVSQKVNFIEMMGPRAIGRSLDWGANPADQECWYQCIRR